MNLSVLYTFGADHKKNQCYGIQNSQYYTGQLEIAVGGGRGGKPKPFF